MADDKKVRLLPCRKVRRDDEEEKNLISAYIFELVAVVVGQTGDGSCDNKKRMRGEAHQLKIIKSRELIESQAEPAERVGKLMPQHRFR